MPLEVLISALAAMGAQALPAPINFRSHPPCAAVDAHVTGESPRRDALAEAARLSCRLATPNRDTALSVLAGRRFGFTVDLEAETVVIAARPAGDAPGASYGAINADLDPLGDGLYAARFQVAHLDEAMLSFYLPPYLQGEHDAGGAAASVAYWRGPRAPALPIANPEPAGAIEELTLPSAALGETRRLVVYTPPGHDLDAGPYPAVIMADGGWVSYLGPAIEPQIVSGRIAPVVLIGLVAGQQGIVEDRSDLTADIRNLDYLPEFFEPHARFTQHLTFAAEEAVAFAQTQYGVSTARADLAVYGRSSGGGFAYHAGLRRPDVFSHAIVHSPGATVPRDPPAAGGTAVQFHIVAGRYEPGFLSSARLAQVALTEQGYVSSLVELSAGHTQEITDTTLIDTLTAIFPGPAAP